MTHTFQFTFVKSVFAGESAKREPLNITVNAEAMLSADGSVRSVDYITLLFEDHEIPPQLLWLLDWTLIEEIETAMLEHAEARWFAIDSGSDQAYQDLKNFQNY